MPFTVKISGNEVRVPFDEQSFIAGRASCKFEEQVDRMIFERDPVGTKRFVTVSRNTFLGISNLMQAYARERNVSVAPGARIGVEANITLVLTKRRPGYFDPLTQED